MNKPIIEIRGLGKKYEINRAKGKYIALRDVITNVAKYPFLFLKSKFKQATGLEKKEEFWALKNIDLKIERGEVVGIIGSNGAGKSTLLKILSQITPPTEGEVVLRGRVGSLLEVGTGFHPELSGRENIFLNGAILGMKKREIEKKFDQIVDFAGIEKFLDTPVKHYSSGMYVRLAFSVAAHMEPDILIVDEVLAVGDAEFQKKCLGKMDEITKQEDRTILFVSHNLEAIRDLCNKCLVLTNGQISFLGKTEEAILHYTGSRNQQNDLRARKETMTDTGEISVTEAWVENSAGKKVSMVNAGEDINLVVKYKTSVQNKSIKFAFALTDISSHTQLADLSPEQPWENFPSEGKAVCKIHNLPLNVGIYGFNIAIRINGFMSTWIKEAAIFEVIFGDFFGTGKLPDPTQSKILLKQDWKLTN